MLLPDTLQLDWPKVQDLCGAGLLLAVEIMIFWFLRVLRICKHLARGYCGMFLPYKKLLQIYHKVSCIRETF
jgi:hypothetical protein